MHSAERSFQSLPASLTEKITEDSLDVDPDEEGLVIFPVCQPPARYLEDPLDVTGELCYAVPEMFDIGLVYLDDAVHVIDDDPDFLTSAHFGREDDDLLAADIIAPGYTEHLVDIQDVGDLAPEVDDALQVLWCPWYGVIGIISTISRAYSISRA